jgi:hypothetical protein
MEDRARFVPEGFAPPVTLDDPSFHLEALGPQHNASDYEAWTSSIDHIHRTPGFSSDGWPQSMSLEENQGDLERHAADFAARVGFTYTVLRPERDEVIGCVYIYPAKDGVGAHVRSWVRESDAELDGPVYVAVSGWLARDWPFKRVEYASRS